MISLIGRSFNVILIKILRLAMIGLGWTTFFSGVITGFEKAVDVGTPIIKELTQEAREYVNNPEQISTN